MKIYEVCCDSNSIGFYFSKAKAMAEVRRRIIVDNEIDYPDYNPNFLKMMQEITEDGYTSYKCHDYAIYEGNLIDDEEDKNERESLDTDYLTLPPAECANYYIEKNIEREVAKAIDGFARQLFNAANERTISQVVPAAIRDRVVDKLNSLGYNINISDFDVGIITITW